MMRQTSDQFKDIKPTDSTMVKSQDRIKEYNLRENGQQQGTKLEKNYISILDKLFNLRYSILNSQKLLHCVHRWRCYYLDFIHRPALVAKSRKNHKDCKKE